MTLATGFTPPFVGCPECLSYATRRAGVIEPAIAQCAGQHGVHRRRLAYLYVLGVHERHLAGKTI